MISHQLLVRAGFIRESVAGRYFFLPLGWRVHDKIKAVIKEEMDKAGAQEMISPVLHPLELWQETNRTSSAGFELMKVTDRRGAEFALGGTAEEMFVDVVRKFQLSYRDLPFNIYQFSTKFRDEARARGGLLRVREFVMKDAYSFHRDAEDFKKTYALMAETYERIFKRLGLEAKSVAADNGYIGGEYCHEFQVEHELGEGRFFVSADGAYSAHEDIAAFRRDDKNSSATLEDYREVAVERGASIDDGVKAHGLPAWQQLKNVLYANEKNELILAVIRGDLNVNETKLQKVCGAYQLRLATEDEVRGIGSEPGFISPVGLEKKVKIVGDISLATVRNFYGGANRTNTDALNINVGRDFMLALEADIAMAESGFTTVDGTSTLVEKRGIEVGNIFQLGHHYTTLMKGAEFMDEDGKAKPYYMGCYGIGLGRTMATIVEKHRDEKGMIWPEVVAPFRVHVVQLGGDSEVRAYAEKVYAELQAAHIDVLLDDREGPTAGEKFADADLIGIPYRIVVSKKTMAQSALEFKERRGGEARLVSMDELFKLLEK